MAVFLFGWLVGFEPATAPPQRAVLPLHHSHHVLYIENSSNAFRRRRRRGGKIDFL